MGMNLEGHGIQKQAVLCRQLEEPLHGKQEKSVLLQQA